MLKGFAIIHTHPAFSCLDSLPNLPLFSTRMSASSPPKCGERDAKRFGDYTGKREDLVIRPLNFPHDSTQKAKNKVLDTQKGSNL
jgi:hypothetical protein